MWRRPRGCALGQHVRHLLGPGVVVRGALWRVVASRIAVASTSTNREGSSALLDTSKRAMPRLLHVLPGVFKMVASLKASMCFRFDVHCT